jgi:hypothetical protein
MRLITLLFSALVVMTACQNQAAEKMTVDQNTVTTIQWLDSALDKGTIVEGQKIEIAFRFKNSGAKPLVIRNVQPSCGCTEADFPKQPIAPGGDGIIKSVFDSKGRPGPNMKTLTVYANTEGQETHQLSFSVNVQKKD